MPLKIIEKLIIDLYKIDFLRTIIVFIRFLIFFKILKKNKTFHQGKEANKDHISINRNNKVMNVEEHNLHYSENLFNLKKTYNKFSGSKTKIITSPLSSIDYLNFENFKVLSIGPRNEGELYFLRSLGFKWKNIYSIDLISYSSKIQLGDIHESDFMDNQFDVIICGWVITYSNNYQKILNEIYRISKNKAIISIGYTYMPEKKDLIRKYKNRDSRFDSNQQIIDHYSDKIKNVYFNFDAYKNKINQKGQSIFIFNIKK